MKYYELPIALFDLDGTLCDYDKAMSESLEKLRSPTEPKTSHYPSHRDVPVYMKERMDLIRRSEDWWESLPKFKLGWDVLRTAQNVGFRIVILSQVPKRNPVPYSAKKKWIDRNLGEDTDIILTRDKSLVYGKVLVDDFPPYINAWLKYHPRGLVIMPANPENETYVHPQVIRYDGSNITEVKSALKEAKSEYYSKRSFLKKF